MDDGEHHDRCIFPLTSLQIGDIQSYFANLHIFLACESGKFYILVENKRRSKDQYMSDPTHWWQFLVHKSRLSPFANTRARKEEKISQDLTEHEDSSSTQVAQSRKWFAFTNAMTLSRHRAFLPVKRLRIAWIENSKLLESTLFGFIVFEVEWNNVRGLNYLNELQTDTLLAIEATIMRRWEFDSVEHAVQSMSSWFLGTINECIILKEHLVATIGDIYHDAQESSRRTIDVFTNEADEFCHSRCSFSSGIEKTEDELDESFCPSRCSSSSDIEKTGDELDESFCPSRCSFSSGIEKTGDELDESATCEGPIESTVYKNVLILFRFKDPHLPFKLKDIIISQLWLLTLLEAGLPSWALFMQSYPGFSSLYRPWMCPLARALYVLISFITVAIGFYDLYKNIPLLKATASHLFGPLFDWIEEWEMVSRIQYLGTMLFLHNFQKAFKCFLVVARTVYSFLSVFVLPIARPFIRILEFFFPLLSILADIAEDCFSVIWMVMETSFTVVGDILELLFLPIWLIISTTWHLMTSLIYPIIWMVFYAPFKLVHGALRLIAFLCTFLYNFLGVLWLSTRGIFQLTRGVESTVTTVNTVNSYNTALWRSLWNDLFSQIFRAIRSILNGFVAFFMACNRHRLSIYNHVKEFIKQLVYAAKRACSKENLDNPRQASQLTVYRSNKLSTYRLKSTRSL